MKEPDYDRDGWCLDNGETYHAEAPNTFWIPERHEREQLEPGDHVKLVFRINLDDKDEPVMVERMWVLVRERVPSGYVGLLDNNPSCLNENDVLWSGVEVPFRAEHVIDIDAGNERTLAASQEKPRRAWPRS